MDATLSNTHLTPYTYTGDQPPTLVSYSDSASGIVLHDYRAVGPVIDSSYQTALCDYAIMVATAKKDPVISDKHRVIWEKLIDEITEQDLDKDLKFYIEEGI